MAETAIGKELSGIPMEYLIAAPLAASIKAQRQLGLEMVRFVGLLAYGEKDHSKAEDILTLPMKLQRPVIAANGDVSVSEITIAPPILGLVPVPALLIDTVDIRFSMEIHSVKASKDTKDASATATGKAGFGIGAYSASVEVTGKVATHRESTRSTDKTAKYDVTVHASQQPPTEGMAKLMDLLASSVEPLKIENKKP